MRFEMCAVDHEAFWNTGLRCQSCENLLENAAPAPAEKPVIEGGVSSEPSGCIFPLQVVTNLIHDPADDPTVIHTG